MRRAGSLTVTPARRSDRLDLDEPLWFEELGVYDGVRAERLAESAGAGRPLASTRDTEDLHSQAIAVKSPTADGDRVVEPCESFDGGFEDHSLPHTD